MTAAVHWATLAHALDLVPYESPATYSFGVSFRQMKRTLGVRASPPPSFRHYLYGSRHGVEIIILTYDVGAGSTQTTYTAVLARIDPPLFLGLAVVRRSLFERLFGSVVVPLGDPAADSLLSVRAFDGHAAELLSPLLPQLVAHAQGDWRPAITDSIVTLEREGVCADPREVGQAADWAVGLAKALAARRVELPLTAREAEMKDDWQRVASAAGFTFDAARMKLQGRAGTSLMEIALETDGQHVRTSFSMAFPHAVGVALFLYRSIVPGYLQGVLTQDIKVGDRDFDELYTVNGYPEDDVRAVLQRPALRHVLKQLGAATTSVQMNHQGLYFRLEGYVPTAAHLSAAVALGRSATAALFGEVTSLGPFR